METDADVMKIHKELAVIDGCAPMLSWGMDTAGNVTDDSGKGFDFLFKAVRQPLQLQLPPGD